MTLILGLHCRDGVVLAADSQRTQGSMRDYVTKLFPSPCGILWGTAGPIPLQQELDGAMHELTVGRHPRAIEGKAAVVAAFRSARERAMAAVADPSPTATSLDCLFAWHSQTDGATFLLRVYGDGIAEFHPEFTAVGNGGEMARFALSRSDYLGLSGLALDPAQMIAFEAADDAIRATATGLGLPVQVAVVTATRCGVLPSAERKALEDTVSVWREKKRGMLVPAERPTPPLSDTGLRP